MGFVTKDSGNLKGYQTGAVRNSSEGKGRYDLISYHALRRLAGVMERGAKIYAARNWEKGIPMQRCIDSAIRHTFQYLEGKRDEDHLAQAMFNLAAIIHFDEEIKAGRLDPAINDLPPPLPDEQPSNILAQAGSVQPTGLPPASSN